MMKTSFLMSMLAGAALLLPGSAAAAAFSGNGVRPLFTEECLNSIPEKQLRAEVEAVVKKAKFEMAYRQRVVKELKTANSNHFQAALKRLELFIRLLERFDRSLASGSREELLRVWLAKREMESFIDYFHWEEQLMQEKVALPASKVFSVKDFGARGDGKNDDGPAIRKAIAAAQRLRAPATVFFPAGSYRIVPGPRLGKMLFTSRCGNLRRLRQAFAGQSGHLNIIEPEHLTLLGENGTKLVMTDPSFSGISITAGYDTTVKNLVVDYDPLPFTQGKILAVSEDKNTAIVKIDDGYQAPDNPNIAKAVMWRFSLSDPKTRTYTGGIYPVQGCKDLGSGKYELKTGAFSKFDKKERMAPGMLCDIKGRRDHTGAVAFADYYSKMTTVENVWVYSSPAVAYHLRTMAFVMINSGVKRAPETDRLVSSNADGMMCGSSITLIGPYLENCLFDSMGDDGINSTSGSIRLNKVAADGRTCDPMYADAGDNVYVIDGNNGQIKAVAKVVKKQGKLQLEPPLPADLKTNESLKTTSKIKPGDISHAYLHEAVALPDVMVDGRSQFGGTAIVNTTYRNVRGLGVQLTSPSFMVENCTFDYLTGFGISGTALMSWRMYYSTHNAVIRNCNFSNMRTGIRFLCVPPYSSGKIEVPSLCDILVENNAIGPNVRNPLEFCNTQDATVRNNILLERSCAAPIRGNVNLIWEKNLLRNDASPMEKK